VYEKSGTKKAGLVGGRRREKGAETKKKYVRSEGKKDWAVGHNTCAK